MLGTVSVSKSPCFYSIRNGLRVESIPWILDFTAALRLPTFAAAFLDLRIRCADSPAGDLIAPSACSEGMNCRGPDQRGLAGSYSARRRLKDWEKSDSEIVIWFTVLIYSFTLFYRTLYMLDSKAIGFMLSDYPTEIRNDHRLPAQWTNFWPTLITPGGNSGE